MICRSAVFGRITHGELRWIELHRTFRLGRVGAAMTTGWLDSPWSDSTVTMAATLRQLIRGHFYLWPLVALAL